MRRLPFTRKAKNNLQQTSVYEEKKDEDRVENLRNEFERQVFSSIDQVRYSDDDEEEEEEEEEEGQDDDENYTEDDEYENVIEDDEGSDDETSARSGGSATTEDLLERAHDRLHMQQLHDEVENLKQVIDRKNVELENLTGQLRRAVATKCDLVSSCYEKTTDDGWKR
jgi:anaerobic ribonucleoside-triphosphate reductase